MKTLYTILLICISSLCSFAQGLPNDFYVTASGDTVYGKLLSGGNTISFKTLDGKKVKVKADGLSSYTVHIETPNWVRGDPAYSAIVTLVLNKQLYEVVAGGNGPVRVLFYEDPSIHNPGVYGAGGKYYYEKAGVLTLLQEATFYKDTQKYMADCPDAISLMTQIPNKVGKNTHRAKMSDLSVILDKYNACAKDIK